MFPLENEYKSLLPRNAHGTYKAARTIWPPCPYIVKSLKTLLLWNERADDLESWYPALGTQILLNFFK